MLLLPCLYAAAIYYMVVVFFFPYFYLMLSFYDVMEVFITTFGIALDVTRCCIFLTLEFEL